MALIAQWARQRPWISAGIAGAAGGFVGLAGGLFSTIGHLAYTRSFAAANASVVLPYDYMRLLMVAAVGYGFFKEIPDIWTWVGGCIIIISTFYISRRDVIKFGTTDQKNKLQSIKVST